MPIDNFGPQRAFDDWTQKIHEIMDEMLKRSFVQFRSAGPWQPHTNVYESEAAFHVCVDVAGMDEDAIHVECRDGRCLSISGVRGQPRPPEAPDGISVHVLEIDEGRFGREIELSAPVDVNGVEANYNKGFLWITLPKTSG